MRYIFVDESWEDYLYWQKTDKKILYKINDLLKVNVLLAGFDSAITLLPGNSERSRKPPNLSASAVIDNTKKKT